MQRINSYLFLFCTSVFLLALTGIVFIYSSSFFLATELCGHGEYFVFKQGIALIFGIILCVIVSVIPTHVLYRYAPFIFFCALIFCLFPLYGPFGCSINGARRWVKIGSFFFQPVELLKPAAILYFSRYLDKQQFQLNQTYLLFVIIVGLIACILLVQPDFGQTVVIAITALAMLFIVQCKLSVLLYLLAGFITASALLVLYKPYRLKRLLIFLNPWDDPQGAGFQVIQSLIAITNGKWYGLGIAHSKQKFFYLPMQHTDFIFSIICEEIGVVGGIAILLLYGMILLTGSLMATMQKQLFHMLVIFGGTFLILVQTLINVSVSTGTAPTKGIGLPFISYGNSSLIGMSIIVGLIVNMAIDFKSKYYCGTKTTV